MIRYIDNILNRITMYRVVLYYLVGLVALAMVFGFFGVLPYSPVAIAFSAGLLTVIGAASNWLFAKTFDAQTNIESTYITSLILALIISPALPPNWTGIGFLIFAAVWATASKYLLAIGKRHLFNPAAFAVALTALTIGQTATWWVGGNLALLPFVVVGGLLIVRKIQRFDLVLAFFGAAIVSTLATTAQADWGLAMSQTFLHSSLFFLAFVMLTEPLTTPPNRTLRILYGLFVGALFAPNVHVGSFYFTPELALLAGNVFAYIVSPKGRYILALKRVETKAHDVYDFVFAPDRRFSFKPGQYLEWTLSHSGADDRGNRRYFTIASSPTEEELRLGVKFYPDSSTFKRKLASLEPGDTISVAHLAGGFTLPRNKDKKLVFIAGGIGITPFRSMIQYLLDSKERRPIVIFYSNKSAADIAYKEVLDRARAELDIETIYAFTDEKKAVPGAHSGALDGELIAKTVPDFRERTFYISGPHGMVDAFTDTLRGMGVSRFKIKSDFFPGFA